MTDNDFDAQRTELANRFASAGAEFLGQMPLAAAALAEVPNTQPQQYAMVGEPKAIRALLPDDTPARRMRHGQRPTEPLEWEPSAIANKAEVDLSSLNVQTGADIELVYCNRDEEFVRLDDVKALLATPPATTGASTAFMPTVLTDERIDSLILKHGLMDQAWPTQKQFHAFAREVAAQAGQVAVPTGWVIVPIEPTPEMIEESRGFLPVGARHHGEKVYNAMLAAAPSPAKESK